MISKPVPWRPLDSSPVAKTSEILSRKRALSICTRRLPCASRLWSDQIDDFSDVGAIDPEVGAKPPFLSERANVSVVQDG